MSASSLFTGLALAEFNNLSPGRSIKEPNGSIYSYDANVSMTSNTRLELATLPSADFGFTLPNALSTGAPKGAVVWWVCCGCDQMVNPSLAPQRCPLCSHTRCDTCKKENVP